MPDLFDAFLTDAAQKHRRPTAYPEVLPAESWKVTTEDPTRAAHPDLKGRIVSRRLGCGLCLMASQPCPHCQGAGEVTDPRDTWRHTNDPWTRTVACPRCQGDGTHYERSQR